MDINNNKLQDEALEYLATLDGEIRKNPHLYTVDEAVNIYTAGVQNHSTRIYSYRSHFTIWQTMIYVSVLVENENSDDFGTEVLRRSGLLENLYGIPGKFFKDFKVDYDDSWFGTIAENLEKGAPQKFDTIASKMLAVDGHVCYVDIYKIEEAH